MVFDWFTVVAQFVNFLILVWLLKRFLYQPILKAIDEREKQITAKIQEAESIKTEAETERDEFHKKNIDFEEQQNELWDKVMNEIKTRRQDLLEEVRSESDAFRARLKKSLREEQDNISLTIIRKTQDEVFAIARKILKELADEELEQRIVNVFVHRLKNLGKIEKDQLSTSFSASTDPILIQSTFKLNQSQKQEIEKTLTEMLDGSLQFTFRTDSKLIGGIELNTNGYKLAWSISEYLDSIKKVITNTVRVKSDIGNEDQRKENKQSEV